MSTPARPELIFDHVGLVVRDLKSGLTNVCSLLPIVSATRVYDDQVLGVSVQFLRDAGGVMFELIAPLGDNSPVAKIAVSGKGVINQVAYRVENLAEAAKYFRARGATPTGAAKSAVAFDGAPVQFFLTREFVVIELIESEGASREFVPV
ncbi:VOC family protein [Bradyrhizobium sp. DASA03005]|uniref:VOC family protein n=1 Tax=Bradyrhizobium TaxID=374 RepID=UPI00155F1EFA|nr:MULTISPECIES: VOC family protein [Bradyrhizobium]MDD1518427.1 glyoxalase [Bradyrhizobium sp. WBAH30]MDD1542225.1 glyoxalase [Bradyrhizobium sp. WBAH41]MDD1556377.1 glyoxalase [Bradyrhizobium sp. WBAH23]MDD1561782.1 glyoxalase [Bradyrhizobium sp. WBAH33]MDD1589196.1 glyoxalase [Bradyrhizobium sp. WBAH42]